MHFPLSKTLFSWLTAKKKLIKKNSITYLCFMFNFVKYSFHSLIHFFLVFVVFVVVLVVVALLAPSMYVYARNKFM